MTEGMSDWAGWGQEWGWAAETCSWSAKGTIIITVLAVSF